MSDDKKALDYLIDKDASDQITKAAERIRSRIREDIATAEGMLCKNAAAVTGIRPKDIGVVIDEAYMTGVWKEVEKTVAPKIEARMTATPLPPWRHPITFPEVVTAAELQQVIHNVIVREVDALRAQHDRLAKATADRVKALEKRLATYDLDPKIHRAIPEKTDYAKVFSDEEDGMEADYRGWPIPKDKVIF